MPDNRHSKPQLRAQLRSARQALDQPTRDSAAQALPAQAEQLPNWQHTGTVSIYLATAGEIDTAPLLEYCLDSGKQVFLPVIQADNSLVFARWRAGEKLVRNRFGIAEPSPEAERLSPTGLDIVFLPLLGWDRRGGRLGMGGGFYDRTFAGVNGPLLTGLAFANQEVDELPLEKWDISLDFVATEAALHRCREDN